MLTDDELIIRAIKNNQNALTEIYDRYSLPLYKYAYRLLGNQMQAEDCVAETFSRFLNAIRKGKGPNQHLRAYLYRIAHNWITDQFVRTPPSPILLDDEMVPTSHKTPESQVAQKISLDLIRNSIQQLTPAQREVISLKYLEGWNNKEISDIMNKPISAIKSLQHRALNAVKKIINTNMKEV